MGTSNKHANLTNKVTHQEAGKICENTHVDEIDYLRGFAIIAVLLIHVVRYIREIPSVNAIVLINVVIDTLAHFAVPLFIFISGFVLSHRYYGQFPYLEFYKKRAKRIIPSYIIISFLYIAVNESYAIFLYPLGISNIGTPDSISLKTVLIKLLTGDACFHLWFFVLIIQLWLLYPLIIKLYEKYSNKDYDIYLLLLLILLQVIWKTFDVYTTNNPNLFSFLIDNIYFFSYIYYFILGIYVCRNSQKILDQVENTKISFTILLILILTVFNSYFNLYGPEIYGLNYKNVYQIHPYFIILPTIVKPIYYSCIFVILFIISKNIMQKKLLLGEIIIKLGKYSFGIYLIHAFFVYIGYIILKKIDISPEKIVFYPALLIFVMGFSYFIVHYLSYFPCSTLIGIERRK